MQGLVGARDSRDEVWPAQASWSHGKPKTHHLRGFDKRKAKDDQCPGRAVRAVVTSRSPATTASGVLGVLVDNGTATPTAVVMRRARNARSTDSTHAHALSSRNKLAGNSALLANEGSRRQLHSTRSGPGKNTFSHTPKASPCQPAHGRQTIALACTEARPGREAQRRESA
jgi:hypothetical protein